MPRAPRTFGSKKPQRPWQRNGADKRKLRGRKLQETKQHILDRDEYQCQQCGRLVEYHDSILDHITPLARGGTDDEHNLQTLCLECDRIKTRRDRQGESKPIGWKPGTLHIICGPPGSGKTTYVNEHKSKGDIVFDFDAVAEALGAERYNHGRQYIDPIESVRQAVLRNASRTTSNTWVIVVDLEKAKEFSERYGGQLIVMQTKEEVCIRRMRSDNRPDIDKLIARVRRWYAGLRGLGGAGFW